MIKYMKKCMKKTVKILLKTILVVFAIILLIVVGFILLQKYWGKMSVEESKENFEYYDEVIRTYAKNMLRTFIFSNSKSPMRVALLQTY